jgi:hypothetical protein
MQETGRNSWQAELVFILLDLLFVIEDSHSQKPQQA